MLARKKKKNTFLQAHKKQLAREQEEKTRVKRQDVSPEVYSVI